MKTVEDLAAKLYAAYCQAVGGKSFNGDRLPDWPEFRSDPAKQKQSDAWVLTATVAAAECSPGGHLLQGAAAEFRAEPCYLSPMDSAEYWLGRLESALRAGSTVTSEPGAAANGGALRKVVAEEGLAGSLDDLFWRMHRHFQNRARQTATTGPR